MDAKQLVRHLETTRIGSNSTLMGCTLIGRNNTTGQKFLYLKNPKTGGTSIYRGILQKDDNITILADDHEDFPAWIKELYEGSLDDYFKFTFIRNPFTRLVSAYLHICCNSIIPSRRISFREFVTMGPDNSILLDLKQPPAPMLRKGLLDISGTPINLHWSFQHEFAYCGDELFVDFVGRFENLYDDWKHVASKLNVDPVIPHMMKSTPNIPEKNVKWDDDLVELVYKTYEKEIELFW